MPTKTPNTLNQTTLDVAEQTRISNVARKFDGAKNASDHARPTNRLHEDELYRVAEDFIAAYPYAKRYTLVYATKDYHGSPFPYAYLIRKPEDCNLHPGLINLPGGKLENIPLVEKPSNEDGPEEVECVPEAPEACALRELKEETGLDGTFPILCGLIAPPPLKGRTPGEYKAQNEGAEYSPFLVYCFRVIIAGSQVPNDETLMRKVHESFQWKDAIPNIPLLLSLFYGNAQGWIMQDASFHHTPFETNLVFATPDHPYTAYRPFKL